MTRTYAGQGCRARAAKRICVWGVALVACLLVSSSSHGQQAEPAPAPPVAQASPEDHAPVQPNSSAAAPMPVVVAPSSEASASSAAQPPDAANKPTPLQKKRATTGRLTRQEMEQKFDELRHDLLDRVEDPPEQSLFDRATSAIRQVAGYRLLSDPKDATKPPLTVYDAVLAAMVVFVGLFVSKRVARWAHRAIEKRPEIDENVATLVEHVLYYALAACFVIFGLQRVHVELTAFAFLGGAIAIGIGFGAQNLISNFISGLILLVERPVKLNDLIEVDGEVGRITVIGARCSQVKLGRGIDVVLPNSVLLDRKVVNWTLSDQRVRYSVRAGVTYGTVARDAAALVEKAVLDHQAVLRTPAPLVIFSEFGDAALIFEAFFWLDVSTGVDSRVVCSDIRFAVDAAFRAAGMTPAPLAAVRDAKPVQG